MKTIVYSRTARVWAAVVVLLVLQAVQALYLVHRESLTFDEGDHSFAGYMMWKAGDYGLNPEHPPLVKMLAAATLSHTGLWVPEQKGRMFKKEAYLDGRDWLARNDGASQRIVFRMRCSTELLAIGLGLAIFLAARRWFGDVAGVMALALVVFDPTILANSALVTTDIGVSLFFVASVYAFYRYAARPGWTTLTAAGLMAGLLLATKHSGILLAPMLVCLVGYEVLAAEPAARWRTLRRLAGGVGAMTLIAVLVLWSFYGFRYAARPAGMVLHPTLEVYAAPLSAFQRAVVMAIAHAHLLPESYLIGLVDVKLMAKGYPTFLLGHVYAHGVWWYFPVVMAIKWTLGLMGLTLLAWFAVARGWLRERRELVYTLAPAAVYLVVAMGSGMNIGARHLLPMDAFAMIFAGAGAAKLSARGRGWAMAIGALVTAHVVSAALVFPQDMAYANELAGGPRNVHKLLSDANVDWAQQLVQVKQWQDRHPSEECWFAYAARPEILPETYGIHCHALPTVDTSWLGGAELVPAQIHGTVLVSAIDWSGCEWPTGFVNPYRGFQALTPDETIEDGVFVYRGTFDTHLMAAESRVQESARLGGAHDAAGAMAMAKEAVRLAPDSLNAQMALGDAAAEAGQTSTARSAYNAALTLLAQADDDAREAFLQDVKIKLAKLPQSN